MKSCWYIILFIVSSLFFISCNSPGSQGNVDLKFNLEKGKVYAYEMDIETENEVQGKTMNSQMEFDYRLEVLDDKNGIFTLRTTYDRIRMHMNMPDTTVELDTDQAADTTNKSSTPLAMMSNIYRAIRGKSFIMKVDATGKITEVSGLEEMHKAALESISSPEQEKPYYESGFKSQFNQENMKQSFEQAFNIYPGKPVKVGDKWERQMTLGMMKMKTIYTVQSIENNKVTLDASSSFDMMGSTGSQDGTYEIDPRTGLIISGHFSQSFEGPMNMTVEFQVKGKAIGQ